MKYEKSTHVQKETGQFEMFILLRFVSLYLEAINFNLIVLHIKISIINFENIRLWPIFHKKKISLRAIFNFKFPVKTILIL